MCVKENDNGVKVFEVEHQGNFTGQMRNNKNKIKSLNFPQLSPSIYTQSCR